MQCMDSRGGGCLVFCAGVVSSFPIPSTTVPYARRPIGTGGGSTNEI